MKILITVAIILAAVIAGVLIFKYFTNKQPAATELPNNWKTAYVEQQKDISKWKTRYQAAADTVAALKTQIGYLSTEKNKSETKLKQYITSYRQAKIENNSTVVLSNCDSLVDELDHVYIEGQIQREQLTDSLNQFYEVLLSYKDSVLVACDSSNSLTVASLVKSETDRKQAEADRDKAKRKSNIGWIAAAIGSFFALAVSILN